MTITEQQSLLVNGQAPLSPEQVHQKLESLDISFSSLTHPAMLTVTDSRAHRGNATGGFSKNLGWLDALPCRL